ncbi:MAG: SDR family NAD(P)-dependent oxidoreductase [Chloracidobacterium sp.]|nr:SDR family NAD(P)-dependent oxidoreductase [Chloracidobacterium sp.]
MARKELCRLLGIPTSSLDVNEKFQRLGLDSSRAVQLMSNFSKRFGRPLSPALVWRYPTTKALAAFLSGEIPSEPEPDSSAGAWRAVDEPIAIVGIGCRLPGGANSPHEFWELLREGVDAIREIPEDRWSRDAYFDEDYLATGKMNTRWGGFLDQVDGFDSFFFGVSPREASQMDPQQRLMLELSWEALEDAGIRPQSLKGSRTGVFFATVFNDYSILQHQIGPDGITAHSSAGSISCIIPNRVSYILGLRGPSLAIDTACSSSLVAVHLACQSIRLGESSTALVGGVSLMLAPHNAVSLAKLGVLSPDGRCKAFDADANGFARGEGGGVLILKRLSDALRDADRIYCVIRGSAVNNDGASNGLTAPNPKAHEEVFRKACENAGVDPLMINYVETHGPGTPLGDPIEASALGAVYGQGRDAQDPLLIGSVKTNIGHLEAAAGAVGLIKAALALKNKQLPANLHFTRPNPHIDFHGLRIKVVDKLQAWPETRGARLRAGVSAFGLGGTNAHVILENYPEPKRLLLVAGDTAQDLQEKARASLATIADPFKPLTLDRVEGKNGVYRMAVLAESGVELRRKLEDVRNSNASGAALTNTRKIRKTVDPVWVFSGVGGQWPGMGLRLLAEEPVFRSALERCDRAMRPHLNWSVIEELARDGQRFDRIDVLWPLMFALQAGLAELWRSFGIRPAAVIGHSLGEIAAAYVAEILTLEEAASIACNWGRLAEQANGAGALVLTDLDWSRALDVAENLGGRAACAIASSPVTTVLAVESSAIDDAVALLEQRGVSFRKVAVPIPAHSQKMAKYLGGLPGLLRHLNPRKAAVPMVSTNLGRLIDGGELDGAYWTRQLCEPVLFSDGIALLAEQKRSLFLEISAHPIVQRSIEETLRSLGLKGRVIPSLLRNEHEGNSLRESLGNLYALGANLSPGHSAAEATCETTSEREPYMLPISARKEVALRDYARHLSRHITGSEDVTLNDICYTASVARHHHTNRAVIVARSRAEIVEALDALGATRKHPNIHSREISSGSPPKVAFIFPGQGSQWPGMGRRLFDREEVFRDHIIACDHAFRKWTDWSLIEELFAAEDKSRLKRVDVVQPTIFGLATGLARLWRSWGVEPDAVVGHSMGEVAAAWVSGALSLEDAAQVICRRSLLLRKVSGKGAMAVVGLSQEKTADYLKGRESSVSIAVSNSPNSTVISGDPAVIEEILGRLEAEQVFCRTVKVDVASHSPQVDCLRDDLFDALAGLTPRRGGAPIFSTVDGGICDGSNFDASYWVRNLREPVQFARATESLLSNGFDVFIEMSPHTLLTGNVKEIVKIKGCEATVINSLHRDEDEIFTLRNGIAKLHCAGLAIDFTKLFKQGGKRVPLPNYRWQRERHWLDLKSAEVAANDAQAASKEAPPEESKPQAEHIYIDNRWMMTPPEDKPLSCESQGAILIFGHNDSVRESGRQYLSQYRTPIALIKPGKAFRDCGNHTFEIDPASKQDYQSLLTALHSQSLLPEKVIHLWSERPPVDAIDATRRDLYHGLYSIIYFTQAMTDRAPQLAARLWYVYTCSPHEFAPQHAAISGSIKTIRQENPAFVYKTLEIQAASGESSRAPLDHLWKIIAQEIRHSRIDEFEIRYHGESRFVRRLCETDIGASKSIETPLKRDGAYLVTGGAGGLGLIFAEHLARRQRVNLVLTGRSELSGDKLASIQKLEKLGAEVLYTQRDVSRHSDVVSLVSEIRSHFGAINGVIHSAGVLSRAFVIHKRDADIESVIAPKVFGALNLDRALENENLDFFVLFSSISAVKGYEGLVDYAYGNSFLDHFAEQREALRAAGRRHGRTISINWSLWRDGGMQLAPIEAQLFLEQTGLEVLTAEHGARLFDVALSNSSVPQCLVGYGDRQRFKAFLDCDTGGKSSPGAITSGEKISPLTSNDSAGAVDSKTLRDNTEKLLREKLSEVTGIPIDDFSSGESFSSYGIDSVIIHHFNAKLAKLLGPIAKTLMFENRNLGELTNVFVKNYSAALASHFRSAVEPDSKTEGTVGLIVDDSPGKSADEMKDRIDGGKESASAIGSPEIAIIGVAGRYPSAENLEEFWRNLRSGRDCITEIPAERWDCGKIYDPDPGQSAQGKIYSRWGGFLDGVDKFDPLFFGVSPKEAETIDPQERILLEIAWTAIEDAGYTRRQLSDYEGETGCGVGVFVGCTSNTYMLLGPGEWSSGNHLVPLSMPWSISNRISHVFDLHGASLTVDTGCASSLTALHLACESIRNGACGMAIVGGVNLILHPYKYMYASEHRMLSPKGRCHPFGVESDGIVIGEGAGAVVLKPLQDAIRDGDNIYAVIKATSNNHGGKAIDYTAPNPNAQADLIRRALANANIDPRTITCIEAHGTGTALGDPIEIAGLTKAFNLDVIDERYCSVGSVKSNIGHLEGAAGMAGLTKLLLQFRHKKLVPSIHAEELNPAIQFEQTPFYVQRTFADWNRPSLSLNGETRRFPRRAGISSFGAGGANAHAILEEYENERLSTTTPSPSAILLSARCEESLYKLAENFLAFFEKQCEQNCEEPLRIEDVAYTLQVGREPFEERLAFIVDNLQEMVEKLRRYLQGGGATGEALRSTVQNRKHGSNAQLPIHSGLERFTERDQLERLVRLWLDGVDVDWKTAHQNRVRRRVSLPTYPFLKERMWIHNRQALCEMPARRSGKQDSCVLHPLIDANVSTPDEIKFKKIFTGVEFYLADHEIVGKPVLPGVAVAEMVRAAGELAEGKPVRSIRNLVFSAPVKPEDPSQAFYVRIVSGVESASFEVYSQLETSRLIHAQGKLVFESGWPTDVERVDVEAVIARCKNKLSRVDSYRRMSDLGLNLGESFQSNQEIHFNEVEAVSRLVLPARLKEGFKDYTLHPSLLDGAQQISAIAGLLGREGTTQVPFAIEEIEILGAISEFCYAHAELIGGASALGSDLRKINISLLDETGRALVRIKKFMSRPYGGVGQAGPRAMPENICDAMSFEPIWEAVDIDAELNGQKLNGRLLVFDTDDRIWTALQKLLGSSMDTILVTPGSRFEKLGEGRLSINPNHPEDYDRLFGDSVGANNMPLSVLHFWSKGTFSSDSEALSAHLRKSVYAVFYISRALLKRNRNAATKLLYAFTNGIGESAPQYAAVAGFAKSLHRESTRLVCKTLEIKHSAPADEPAPEFLANVFLLELQAFDKAGLEVKWENETRFIRRLKAPAPEALTGAAPGGYISGGVPGVYLITGGARGLGFIFARRLAQEKSARIALVGRSELSAEIRAKLESLKKIGAEAIYLKADVTKQAEVEAVVNQIKTRFGRINGLIHSAGVTKDSWIVNKTPEEIEEVFAPKLFGVLQLDKALRNEPLDFFVMFSSTTSFLGQPGQSDYGYANRFMDSFAQLRESWRERSLRSGKTLSINWPFWRDGGMRIGGQNEQALFTSTGMLPMSTETGLKAFERGLTFERANLFIIDGDFDRIEKAVDALLAPPSSVLPAPHEPPSRGQDHELKPLLEKDLLKILSDLLKISEARINVNSNISDYGIESVGLTEFANKINGAYGTEITPAIFFEYPTLSALSAHLIDGHAGALLERHDTAVILQRTSFSGRGRQVEDRHGPVESAEPNILGQGQFHGRQVITDNSAKGTVVANEPMAIIGISGIMPQSEDLDVFWRNLEEGRCLIDEVPRSRWNGKGSSGQLNEEVKTRCGGFIDGVDRFDARFFGISRREAEFMDPQQRLFLQVVWKAIEDAGYKASDLAGRKIGVYAAVAGLDYNEVLRENGAHQEVYSTTGVFHSILANRVSYLLDLRGPSVPVDTGCSSALVAIRQAIESIWAGSCEMAITGGVNLLLTPSVFISFGKAGMLSEDGRCKTFDKAANGYVRSEGVGAMLIKPLSKAVADGDHIHAIIRGSAVNHGGRVNTLTAPNPNAQAELIVSAFEEGAVDPASVSYIEAHGTGTSLGDPIEINGLKKAFKDLFQKRGKRMPQTPFCGIGAVKPAVGHLETAAALAGIFKILLAFRHYKIPATINFTELNPYIDFEASPFYLVTQTIPWRRARDESGRDLPRRAGVSSFGFGGVNGHLVLEEYIENKPRTDLLVFEPHVITLSAKNIERLKDYCGRLADYIENARSDISPSGATDYADTLLDVIKEDLKVIASRIMNLPPCEITFDEPLLDYGFDPVHLAELVNQIGGKYRFEASDLHITENLSINSLANNLFQNYAERFFSYHTSLLDVAYTLQVGREAMFNRLAVVVSRREELIEKLRAFEAGDEAIENLYVGSVEENDHKLGFVLGGLEGKDFIANLIQNRQLDRLAQLWVSGVDIDWNLLYAGSSPRRISLPTYPFAKDRHWISAPPDKNRRNKALSPLIDQVDLEMSLHEGVVFRKKLALDEPIVSDHKVKDHLVFPGVGHLAMAIAAVSIIREAPGYELSRITWLRPLTITDEHQEASLVMNEQAGEFQFKIQSFDNQALIVHSSGVARPLTYNRATQRLSVEDARARCATTFDKESLYTRFAETGVTLGRYFQTLENVALNSEEVVAQLRLPADYEEEANEHFIHPALLDGALQAMGILCIQRSNMSQGPLLPFAIDKLELLERPGKECYLHATVDSHNLLNAVIVNKSGRVCVRIRQLTLLQANKETSSQGGFYYLPFWRTVKETELAVHARHTGKERILIVHPENDLGLSRALSRSLPDNDVYAIALGDRCRRISSRAWELPRAASTGWDEALSQMPKPDVIYFLGGILPLPIRTGDASVVEESQQQGVFSLLRLFKALGKKRYAHDTLRFSIVTNNVHQVNPDDVIIPYAATLHGFVRAASKEFPQWIINSVDINGRDGISSKTVNLLNSISIKDGSGALSLRDGRLYVQSLEPADLPAFETIPLRFNGVYLIIGGAGGIGLELARHLAEKFKARLILAGRGNLTPSQTRKIAEIENCGGEALYVKADASNRGSLSEALTKARARFGDINGVFHSAIVLEDSLIESMEESALRRVLDPKVFGSVNLHQEFHGRTLDFMLFFSSALSFTGNAGQSNYTAACAFKDAYARFIGQSESYPVKIINWGYWGTVGVVATESYNRRMAAHGLHSIESEQGMKSVEVILANRLQQVIAIPANTRALRNMGFDLSVHAEVYPEQNCSLIGAAIDDLRRIRLDAGELTEMIQAFDEVEMFSQHLLLAWFRKVGVFNQSSESYGKGALERLLKIAPRHKRLFYELLNILARAGFITLKDAQIRGTSTLDRAELKARLGDLHAWKARIVTRFPQKRAIINLLTVCMDNYAQILRGEALATDVIFPGSSMELVEGVYRNNHPENHFNMLLASSVRSYIERRIPQLKENEKIRIIEIGAGTGGTSELVFDAIRDYAERLVYDYTDISKGFTRYGRKQYGEGNGFVNFRALDIERSIEEQGFEAGGYEIAIAANALHATRRLENTLTEVKRLLKTNGWLILAEVTANQIITTLTFGLLDGWWIFEDEEERVEGAPVVSREGWERKLKECGYERVESLGIGETAGGKTPGQHVIIAESNGIVRIPFGKDGGASVSTEIKARPKQISNKKGALVEPKATFAKTELRRDPLQFVEGLIIELMESVLQSERGELPVDQPFNQLGIDSILAVEISNLLNKRLGITLRSTELFNYSTIRRLSAYIVENFDQKIDVGAKSVTPSPAYPEETRATAIEPEKFSINGRVAVADGVGVEEVQIGSIRFENAYSESAILPTPPANAPSRQIAIIGMSGRFPDARNVDEFLKNLLEGKNSVREIDRWDMDALYDPDVRKSEKTYSKWAALLSEIEYFEPLFFNISPKEAEMMDPRQRLFLEESWKAIEDSGYSDRQLEGMMCGVFVGCGPGDYRQRIAESNITPNPYIFSGNQNSILTARVSYLLNLKGPSISVDTACSSSLVALHLACDSLRNGSCEMAIVGGVEVITSPEFLILGSRGGMLSPEGKCKTFDQSADGFAAGEAVAAIVIKRLEDAVRDGDHIYAVIEGTGINQDGKTNGITAPSGPSQVALESEVYERYQIDPDRISYVEAHGTGTKLGDPIEVQALTEAFRKRTKREGYCAIGSVKTNIGHTLTAAGIAGLIKVLLCLREKKLVPSLHVEKENEYLGLKGSPFYVNREVRNWEAGGERRAAISAFGFSGTNAHVVVREWRDEEERRIDEKSCYLIVLSGKSEDALRERRRELLKWLEEKGEGARLRDIAYTLERGRSHYEEREAIVARSKDELKERLRVESGERERKREGRGRREAEKEMEKREEEISGIERRSAEYRRRLEGIGELYEMGAEIKGEWLYEGEDHRRLPLPTYPFAREYYWVPQTLEPHKKQSSFNHAFHPMIDRNSSSFDEQRFSMTFTGQEFYLSDHKVEGHKILPAVVYLEMARTTCEISTGAKVTCLRDVVWANPMRIGSNLSEVSINLHRREKSISFEIRSADRADNNLLYAQGELDYEAERNGANGPTLDLESVKRSAERIVSGSACYKELKSLGFEHGPSFRVIKSIYIIEGGILAELELPRSLNGQAKDFILHPSLLDGTLQSGLWLEDQSRFGVGYLPFSVSEVRIYRAVTENCYAWVRPHTRKSNVAKLNAALLDSSGRALIEIDGYYARPYSKTGQDKNRDHKYRHATESADGAIAELFKNVEIGLLDVQEATRLINDLTVT